MVSKIQKWGNSQGLRLPKHLLEEARIFVGDDVEATARDGEICIVRTRQVRGRVDLAELVDHIPEGYRTEELDWGEPVGREVW